MKPSAALFGLALLMLAAAVWMLTAEDGRSAPAPKSADGDAASVIHVAPRADAGPPALPSAPPGRDEHPLPPAAPALEPVAAPVRADGLCVEGLVVRLSGERPLPGAEVQLLGMAPADRAPPVLASTITGDDGVFRLAVGDVRPTAVRVTWQSFREVLGEGSAFDVRVPREPVVLSIAVEPDKPLPKQLLLKLDTGWTLVGKVLDTRGVAVQGAFVFAGKDGPEARTKPDGIYELQDIERVTTATAVTAWAPFRVRQALPLLPPPGASVRMTQDFVLGRSGQVSGFVIDQQGRSLPGAIVIAVVAGPPDGSAPIETASATSDDAGRYTLQDLPDGRFDLVCAWQPHEPGSEANASMRRAARLYGVRVQSDAPAEADFRLTDGVTLSGRILDPKGVAHSVRSRVEYWSLDSNEPSATALLVQGRASVKADGSFVLTGLDPGPGELRVIEDTGSWRRPPGTLPKLPWARQLFGDTDSTVSVDWTPQLARRVNLPPEGLVDVFIQPADPPGLKAVVVDAAGHPLAGVAVVPEDEEPGADKYLTDADGAFTLRLSRWDRSGLRLHLSDEVHLPAFIDLPTSAGFSDLGEIVLKRAPALKLLVVDDESGEPLPRANVSWHQYGGARQDSVTRRMLIGSEQIVLRADRMEGHWVLIIEEPEHRAWRRSAVLDASGEPLELIARLVRR